MAIDTQSNSVTTALDTTSRALSSQPLPTKREVKKQEVSESAPEVTVKSQPIEAPTPEAKSEPVEIPREKIEQAVDRLRDYAANFDRDLQFSVDDATGKTVVQLLDSEDNVLRQIPSEEVLEMMKRLEQNKGLIFRDEA